MLTLSELLDRRKAAHAEGRGRAGPPECRLTMRSIADAVALAEALNDQRARPTNAAAVEAARRCREHLVRQGGGNARGVALWTADVLTLIEYAEAAPC